MQILIKIILTALFSIIFLFSIWQIWTREIDVTKWLKKATDFIPLKENFIQPEIDVSLGLLPLKYQTGVEAEGIKWNRDFETHIFNFLNKSAGADILDLRIDIELPGAIIQYKIEEKQGCQEISFSQNLSRAGIGQKGKGLLQEGIEYYINNLSVNVIKLYPGANFSLRLVLNHLVKDHGGTIGIKYRFKLSEGKLEKKYIVYPIKYFSKESNQLIIDKNNPITGEYEGHFLFVPKKLIIFGKDGSVRQEE